MLGCVSPSTALLAVVKADAYGHGASACARALERKVWGFGVSLVEEGIELRRAGVQAPIVVLGSFFGLGHRDVVAYRLTPVVSQVDDVERFGRALIDLGVKRFAVHLKIDTGMSRLGVQPGEVGSLLAAVAAQPLIEVSGVCTHLAEADTGSEAATELQLERFARALSEVTAASRSPLVVHVANSAAIRRFPSTHRDLVRPGLALYGISPSDLASYPGLRPVLAWRTRVVAVRTVAPGVGVSYGGTFVAAAPTRIATIPIGYADGYHRRMSGRAEVLVRGVRCKVVGTITMDMAMVDCSALPTVEIGDEVTLIGQQGQERIAATELAAWADTIPWEIVCAISKRVPRVYLGEAGR